ncbi:MAG: hypothetical protein D6729_18890 [Deltaproteobacteria bacterium]|nr:MAG: hypothetical protein D6729_18890 [Deltaproteobacteria bacterium]
MRRSATGILSVFTPPTLTQVSPAAVCENVDYTLTLTGTDIAPGATVALVDPQSGTTYDADSVTVTGSTRADATWLAGSVPPGSYDLTLDNGGGCEDTVAGVVDVKPEPFVFFVDPPVLYNGASFQVTVYISGLDAPTSAVELIDAQGTVTPLVASSAPGQFNRIFAEVPAGLPAGAYDVRVTSDVGCVGTLPAGLTLTDTLTVAVDSIDPAYVSPTRRTAVTIRATDPVPMGQVGFVDTPRAYLSPNPPQPGVFATALRAVVFQDDKTLSAVVPANMSPGVYDLVVVNPDGTVGLLTGGLTVTSAEPPRITAVQPASLDNNTPQTATVLGEHFDTSGVTVDMHCREPDGTESTVAATVLAATLTDSSVDAIFPTDLYPTGTVCLVILTNSDGASFTYSAISLKNPAQNLFPWTAAPPMTTPRQGHALVAARPTDTSRFVYAIGGDDGSSVHASVEASQVGVFGNMGAFRQERHALPEPRTFLGAARIGRFIYAVGGSDGTAAADSTYRAQILDPLDTPEIVDLSLSLDSDVSGLGAGRWFYRVSALFPASDPANPGGESLPGETLVVQIPAVSGVELTLQWDPIPGAAGYRIYRTPGPDLGADAVELLAEVSGGGAVTYTDDGTVATDPAVTPLPPGSLGVWHAVDLLPAAREAHAVVAAPDPATPNLWHLYALGGRDAGGYLDSYAYLSVTIHPPAQPKASETHTLSGWSTGTGTLQNSRAYVGAWLVDEVDLPPVGAGNHWIYVGPGEGPLGATGAVDAAQVPAGGDIPAFTAVNRSVSNDRRGAGYGDGSGFLYLFGGGTGGSDSGVSAEMCTSTGSGCSSVPPDLEPDAWNSLGISMSEPRVYCAAAQESAFFFVSGGYNGVAVTASVDRTVQ